MLFASYTRSKADSNAVLDFSIDNVLFSPQAGGPLPWDTPNRFLSSGYMPLPGKFSLAYSLDYRDGFPFSLVNENQELVGAPGSMRFPRYFSLDLQFERRIQLFGFMWARAGKKVLFMGGEFGQWREWDHDGCLDWHLLAEPDHRGVQNLVRDLNRLYRGEPALWESDHEPSGFQWIDANNADENVIAFIRISPSTGRRIVCVCNFSPVVRTGYRVGVPASGLYREILNTDSTLYGGSNQGNAGAVMAQQVPWHGLPHSLGLTLPPLATLWFEVPKT